MTVLTAQETALLRSRPHNTKLYLSIFQPREVFSGIITGTVAKGDQTLSLYNTTGTSAGFVSGMTMLVGTTPGGDDKGRIRAKSLTTGTITVSENSDINWAVGDYIRVIGFFEVWPVFPRIIQDPSDETNTLWYKDYDIPYTNQNSILGYFICMGPHRAKLLENGSCQIYYSAEGTEHVRSDETGTSYYWGFGGGSPSVSNAQTPGWVTYTSPGFFTTRLVVSGSVTQSSDLSDRHVAIYNRMGEGTINPIERWELLDLGGSRDQGGYTASIRIFEDISSKRIKDGSLVVIFADDRYVTTEQSIGGNATNNSDIVFVGYIIDGTIKYNYKDSYVDFDIASPTEFMKMAEGFSVSVQDSDDPAGDAASNPDIPSGWVAVLNMDIKKAIYHYLKWHSTVLKLCDFKYIGTNQSIQYFDTDRTSIYDAINTLISSAVVGGICSDRQGRVYAETDIYVSTGSYNTGLSLSKQDWMNEPAVEERTINEVSYIEMGGIAYNGSTFSALMAAAPGATPAYRGKIQRIQGLALTDQTQLNSLAGNIYAQLNAKYPNIEIQLAGNYRNFDIAPQEFVPLTIERDDTIRGITFNQKSFFINNMRWTYNAKNESFLPVIGLEEVASGFTADTLDIPDIPPFQGDSGGGFTIPPIILPPITLPPWPTIPGADVATNWLSALSYHKFSEAAGVDHPAYPSYAVCVNNDQTYAYTVTFRPTTARTVTFHAVLAAFTTISGNIRAELRAVIRRNGVISTTLGTNYQLIPLSSQTGFTYFDLISLSIPVLGNEVITVRFDRTADVADDTYEDEIGFVGVYIT